MEYFKKGLCMALGWYVGREIFNAVMKLADDILTEESEDYKTWKEKQSGSEVIE